MKKTNKKASPVKTKVAKKAAERPVKKVLKKETKKTVKKAPPVVKSKAKAKTEPKVVAKTKPKVTVKVKTKAKAKAKTNTVKTEALIRDIKIKRKTWPVNEEELKDFIKASAVVFSGLILILFFIFFLSYNSFSLIEGIKIRAIKKINTDLVIDQGKDFEEINRHIYYPEKEMTVDERFKALSEDGGALINEEVFMLIESDPKELLSLKFLNSPDGQKFATIIRKEDKQAVVLNGSVGTFYDAITFMIFSPDSKRFAYGVKKEGKELVVLDGEEGISYDWIFPPRLFSPDSQYFIYKTRNSEGDFYVFNQTEGEAYDQLYEPFYNEDENSMIFFSRLANTIYRNSLQL